MMSPCLMVEMFFRFLDALPRIVSAIVSPAVPDLSLVSSAITNHSHNLTETYATPHRRQQLASSSPAARQQLASDGRPSGSDMHGEVDGKVPVRCSDGAGKADGKVPVRCSKVQ